MRGENSPRIPWTFFEGQITLLRLNRKLGGGRMMSWFPLSNRRLASLYWCVCALKGFYERACEFACECVNLRVGICILQWLLKWNGGVEKLAGFVEWSRPQLCGLEVPVHYLMTLWVLNGKQTLCGWDCEEKRGDFNASFVQTPGLNMQPWRSPYEDYKVSHLWAAITLSACVLCLCVPLEAGKRETVNINGPKDIVLSPEQEILPIPCSRNHISLSVCSNKVIRIDQLLALFFLYYPKDFRNPSVLLHFMFEQSPLSFFWKFSKQIVHVASNTCKWSSQSKQHDISEVSCCQ